MKKMRWFSVVCLFSFLLGSLGAATLAGGKDPLMDLLPDNTLFCVRINNFTASLELLDQYLAGASPMPLSMTFNMFLGGAMGDPMLAGMNKYGSLVLVGIGSKDQPEPAVALLLPVTDPKQYTSSPNCQGPDESGLYTLNVPNSPAGPMSFVPLEGNPYLLVGPANQKAALQTVRTCLKEKKNSLTQRVNLIDAQNASSAPAWIWLNMETGYELLAPVLRKGMEEGVKQAQAQPSAMMGMDPNGFGGLFDAFDGWMRQTDSLSVVLTPKPDLLTAEMNFIPKQNTELAKLLVRDPAMKSGFKMGGYLDPEAPISGLMNMNKPLWNKVNQIFIEMFAGAMGGQNKSVDLIAKFKPLIEKSMTALGSEIAFSFGYHAGTPPFSMREVIEINDEKAMREVLQESTGMVNDLYSSMGLPATFSFKEKASQYQGVSIDQASIQFALADSASAEEKAAIETIYGKEGLTYPFAVSKNKMMVTMGPNADAELKKLIDLQAMPPAMPADMQTAMKIIPQADTADYVMSLNVIRLMKGMSEMMATMAQTAAPQGTPVPPFAQMLEGIPMNTQSTMAIGTHIEQGRIQTHLALPKQHLMEIVAVAMQVQQKVMMQQMQQQMQQQQQPQSQPVPAPAPGTN
jgi:hypothetical protein